MRRSNRAIRAGAAACLAFAGCGRAAETPVPPAGPRIVSLSPALSRTCQDFGLAGRIVGRSDFCSFLPRTIPAVGSLYDVDLERLIRLQPTHVLVQPPAGGIDPGLERLSARYGFALGHWRLSTIGDIRRTVRELPATLFPPGPERREAQERAAALLAEIDRALAPAGETLFSAPVMLVAGVEPVLAFGRETYLDDILTALGGTNAVSRSGWVELSLEEVIRIDPAAIVLVRPDEAPPSRGESPGGLQALDLSAVREGRVAVLAHPDTHYPSTGIVAVADQLRAVLVELAQEP